MLNVLMGPPKLPERISFLGQEKYYYLRNNIKSWYMLYNLMEEEELFES